MLNCKVTKEQGRNLIFEILIQSKMLEIIDLFDDIWEIFNVWKPKLEKQVSLYETESVDTNRIVITINPKKIFWEIKNKIKNKKICE